MSEIAHLADDPDYRARLVASLYAQHPEEWRTRAACAPDAGDPPHDATRLKRWFLDEVSDAPVPAFPETVYRTMRTCFGCPVRRECLASAYASETHIDNEEAVKPKWVEDNTRYGIRGGAPGRIRERFAAEPDRLDVVEAWFQAVALARRWEFKEAIEALWSLAPSGSIEETGA